MQTCTVLHLSYKRQRRREKRNHIPIPTDTDIHTSTYPPRTKTLREKNTHTRITVWKINSFYRKIEEKQWNTISNDKWHKILQVTVTEEANKKEVAKRRRTKKNVKHVRHIKHDAKMSVLFILVYTYWCSLNQKKRIYRNDVFYRRVPTFSSYVFIMLCEFLFRVSLFFYTDIPPVFFVIGVSFYYVWKIKI